MAKVLLVEDDAKLIESYVFLLTKVGHDVQQASNGAEGIEKVKAFQPDLVLLDMLMPGSNGLEFLQQLHDTGSTAKVVVMSNLDNFQAQMEASKLGANSYILKSSLSPTQLADLVQAEVGA